MKKTDLSELLSSGELKQFQDIEKSCGKNAIKAKLTLCLLQLENLVSRDLPELKTQITNRIKLAQNLTAKLPKQ